MNDEDNDTRQSEDDALEPQDDIYSPTRDQETLPEDGDRPAAPADDTTKHHIPLDDPRTDSGLDEDELYSEGLAAAMNSDDDELGMEDEPQPLDPENEV